MSYYRPTKAELDRDEYEMANPRCEDFPCCGHTDEDPCNYTGPTADDYLSNPAKYHLGCDHNTGYCEYEDDDDYEPDPDAPHDHLLNMNFDEADGWCCDWCDEPVRGFFPAILDDEHFYADATL